ncbi:hypothetical protein [Limnoraphis robusta]|uniref:Uncharacterized protein n=1 Tax=Limnoraphis robusta CS-951 TaxID=1637645 RepID=A0A0F5YDM4_9CYAN|nr:hypothetical protein [Limnoraphis robusta]KKD36727.1 hypothetical protein WN50_18190 [Limnoraphis robusta CS-951]
MSQQLYFYKIKVFTGKVAESFEPQNISDALKALIGQSNLEENDKLKEILFEEIVKINPVLHNLDPDITQIFNENKVDFFENTGYFLMSDEILSAIGKRHGFLSKTSNKNTKNKKENTYNTERTEDHKQLKKDYKKLQDLFNKNLLIARVG